MCEASLSVACRALSAPKKSRRHHDMVTGIAIMVLPCLGNGVPTKTTTFEVRVVA